MNTELEKLKNDTSYSVRTQLSLSRYLKVYIDKEASKEDISMSAYIRKAIIKLVEDNYKNDSLKTEAIKNFVGSDSGKNSWGKTQKSVLNWQKKIRKDK